eukprot:8005_1
MNCCYGRNCTRVNCWYNHPLGRKIDEYSTLTSFADTYSYTDQTIQCCPSPEHQYSGSSSNVDRRHHSRNFQGNVGNRGTRGRNVNRFTDHDRNWKEFQVRDGVKRGEVYRPSRSETYEGVNIRIGIGRTDAAPPSGNIRGRGKIRQQIHGHDQRRYDNDRDEPERSAIVFDTRTTQLPRDVKPYEWWLNEVFSKIRRALQGIRINFCDSSVLKNIDPHMRHRKRNGNRHKDIIMVSKKNEMLRVLDAAQVNKDDADQISLVILCNGIILASTKARATHLTTVVCGALVDPPHHCEACGLPLDDLTAIACTVCSSVACGPCFEQCIRESGRVSSLFHGILVCGACKGP